MHTYIYINVEWLAEINPGSVRKRREPPGLTRGPIRLSSTFSGLLQKNIFCTENGSVRLKLTCDEDRIRCCVTENVVLEIN